MINPHFILINSICAGNKNHFKRNININHNFIYADKFFDLKKSKDKLEYVLEDLTLADSVKGAMPTVALPIRLLGYENFSPTPSFLASVRVAFSGA